MAPPSSWDGWAGSFSARPLGQLATLGHRSRCAELFKQESSPVGPRKPLPWFAWCPIGLPLPPAWQCQLSQDLPWLRPAGKRLSGREAPPMGCSGVTPGRSAPQEGSCKAPRLLPRQLWAESWTKKGASSPPTPHTPPEQSLWRETRPPRTLWLCWCPTATAAAVCACRCVLTCREESKSAEVGMGELGEC